MTRGWAACSIVMLALVATGCREHVQSALDPRGPQAGQIWNLSMLFFVVCTLVWIGVAVTVYLALFRRNRQVLERIPPEGEPGAARVVGGAVAITVVILAVFLVYSIYVHRATTPWPDESRQVLNVSVVGHQWWWEFRYEDDTASRTFTTANEMRIPVGRPVLVHVTTRDVIHSFWVPNLHGKIDLVPGKVNTIWIQADVAGEYRGQCAEFCGLQHAKMAFVVVAVPPDEYETWAEAYRRPALEPADPVAVRGREVFLEAQCSLCHRIRGTPALASVAPDLTRVGARRTLAAGTIPNTRGNLAGWILDPQHVKPGNFMPPTSLAPDDLHALLTYLEGLR